MKSKFTKGKMLCAVAALIIFGSYIVQKVLNLTVDMGRTALITEALVFSALTAIVYFLISKSDEIFYGILIAIFGLRMMPPDISDLSVFSDGAALVYFIVGKFSFAIFLMSIIRLYKKQKDNVEIQAIPIIATILIVPFFNEIKDNVSGYITGISDDYRVYAYFAGFAIYSIAMICLLFTATRSNASSAKLICDYQMIALMINAGRRVCSVIFVLAQGEQISKSYYCWILIYGFFFLAFYLLRKRKNVNMLKTA